MISETKEFVPSIHHTTASPRSFLQEKKVVQITKGSVKSSPLQMGPPLSSFKKQYWRITQHSRGCNVGIQKLTIFPWGVNKLVGKNKENNLTCKNKAKY